MTNKEIVLKLIGNIHPQGESYADSESFDNLRALCELVDNLIMEINDVADNYNRREASMAKAGNYALKFLTETRLWLNEQADAE